MQIATDVFLVAVKIVFYEQPIRGPKNPDIIEGQRSGPVSLLSTQNYWKIRDENCGGESSVGNKSITFQETNIPISVGNLGHGFSSCLGQQGRPPNFGGKLAD